MEKNHISQPPTVRLWVLAFLAGINVGIWYFLPFYIVDLGGNTIDVGLISTIPSFVAAFIQLSVGEMLETLISMSTVKDIKVETDPERLRPIDADLQVPNTAKFNAATGWKPEIPFKTTMSDFARLLAGTCAFGPAFFDSLRFIG